MSETTKLQQEFLQAYDQFSDAIFRYCFFRLRDREVALDLMQETFTRTWQHISKAGSIDNLRAFLYRVAKNAIIDYVRKKKALSLDELKESGFDPGIDKQESMKNQLDGRQILEVLDRLDDKYKDIVIMRFIDDLRPKEIAEALDLSENVVSVRLNRALEKLRSLLQYHE